MSLHPISRCPKPTNKRSYIHMLTRSKNLAFAFITPYLPHSPPSRRYYSKDSSPDLPETYKWPSNPSPTPYQIFSCSKESPYSKRRYYELVKLYHPDMIPNNLRHQHQCHYSLPEEVRLERFRLIVAANEILSDPHKKRAYDRYGAGWSNHSQAIGVKDHRNSQGHKSNDRTLGKKAWWECDWTVREGHPDPSANATWEDWERYYEAYRKYDSGVDSGAQKPVYMSNSIFFTLVILLGAAGAIATFNHATQSSQSYIAERDRISDRIGKELWKTRQQAMDMRNRDEQIRRFVKNREAMLSGWEAIREKELRILPAEDERCNSGDITSMDSSPITRD